MRLLRLAVEKERWDLTAHAIILATARVLDKGERADASRNKTKRCPKGHTKA